MTRAVRSPLLDDGAGQGSPSGRPLLPSDPWNSKWIPPTRSIVAKRHIKLRECLDRHSIPSQGAKARSQDAANDADEIGVVLDSTAREAVDPAPIEPTPPTVEAAGEPLSTIDDENDQPEVATVDGLSLLGDREPPPHPVEATLDDALAIHRLVADLLEAPADGPDLLPEPQRRDFGTSTSGSSALALADLADAVLEPVFEPLSEPALDPPPPEAPAPPPSDLTSKIDAEAARESKQRRRGKVGRGVVTSLIVAANAYWYYVLATLFIAIAVPLAAGWDSTTIMSGSMEPVLSAGDVVSFEQYEGEALAVGTIVRFDDTIRPGGTVTHRIVGVNPDGSYRTKGDANREPDSTPVPSESVRGVATLVAPHAGLPQYWWATDQYGWLAAWVVLTAGAATVVTVSDRVEASRKRRWLRPAIAVGIVAALAGVGTAAWSSAAFASGTSNPGNQLAAAASFSDFSHLGSIGIATCSTTTSTTLTLGSAVPAGSTIIIRYAMRNRQQNAALGASDTQGNSYSVDASAVNGSRTATAILSSYITTALSSGDQITVTHPRGRAVVVSFDEYSGVTSGSRVSASGTNTGNSRFPSVTVTPAHNDTLIVGSVSTRINNTTFTQPAGWSALDTGRVRCARRMIYGGGWTEKGIAGAVTYDPVLGNTAHWAEAVVAYRSS